MGEACRKQAGRQVIGCHQGAFNLHRTLNVQAPGWGGHPPHSEASLSPQLFTFFLSSQFTPCIPDVKPSPLTMLDGTDLFGVSGEKVFHPLLSQEGPDLHVEASAACGAPMGLWFSAPISFLIPPTRQDSSGSPGNLSYTSLLLVMGFHSDGKGRWLTDPLPLSVS